MTSRLVVPTILIAEDDPNDALMLQVTLEQAGATQPILNFGNGAEIIQFLRELAAAVEGGAAMPRCLLFLDLHLPQVDGCGVLAWAKRQKALAGLRIIILSGSGDSMDMERAAALNPDRLLVKPAKASVLTPELEYLAGKSAQSGVATG
jgi:two-component system response regulator